ncbi:DUF1028 domain-containing protein [Glycomyces buryatensis]|uniref:DUF1028 domain-containing protein n=1 Tax=Glycomyces buryatensis TaxID=2570927 RepID=A0A4S8PSZ5_9ACTN|nr:DUF1028 domain-containing protein [Glycomyces buryatensis]THV32915.1 DUF1028 domain-containing protein [Glycomyces buryatensis]
MTFSIVAHSPEQQAWGVAVATKSLAVGAMVPAAEFQTGALATQAWTNMSYREVGLALLRAGFDAAEVVAELFDRDPDSATRQIGVVDRNGVAVSRTGPECLAFAGGLTDDGCAIQGNLLTGPEVLEAMHEAWSTSDVSEPLAARLLEVLAAGDDAGGDRRGRQSAALYVVGRGQAIGHGSRVLADLRVDDAPRPVDELQRLFKILSDQMEAS